MPTFIKTGLWETSTTAQVPKGWLNLTKLIKDNSGGSPGNYVPVIEVTYSELLNLKNTSALVKGQNYLLTDYETTYMQPVTNVNKSSGVIEPLIITATDINKLHNVCKSTLYPQDIVYYEITGDIGNGKGTEGFTKGKIYRRIDTLRNNDIGTDWRHIKYDRDGVDKLLFEDYTDVYNNKIETYFLFNNVIGRNFNNNTIGNGFFGNRILINFYNNRIGNDFYDNAIADGFTGNVIGNDFNYNTIGDNFRSNTIGNHFGSNTGLYYFINNEVGDNFYYNTIGNDFNYNTIGYDFSGNTIGDHFGSNTIGDNFGRNIIKYGFQGNGNSETPFVSINTEFRNYMDNFTSSTEIENKEIDVVVFKSPNGTKKQRYYDDSNNLVINNL